MNLQKHFDDHIKHGLYLKGWSPKTVLVYKRAFTSFQQSLHESDSNGRGGENKPHAALTPSSRDSTLGLTAQSASVITKTQLEAWVVSMRQRGLSPAGCNIYIRALNAFCSWLHEQEVLPTRIKLKQVKSHTKPVQVFSDAEIRKFLASKPKRRSYLRTWILIALMFDTGCRIDEVLQLEPGAIDFDNLLLTVNGKGGKQRKVPFSAEMRRHLWPYCSKLEGRFVFGTRTDTKLSYRNAYRNMKLCFAFVGVSGEHVHPHNLRHTFSCNYVRKGGSIYSLSRILGHSSITTTEGYLRGLQVQEFERSHSLLAR